MSFCTTSLSDSWKGPDNPFPCLSFWQVQKLLKRNSTLYEHTSATKTGISIEEHYCNAMTYTKTYLTLSGTMVHSSPTELTRLANTTYSPIPRSREKKTCRVMSIPIWCPLPQRGVLVLTPSMMESGYVSRRMEKEEATMGGGRRECQLIGNGKGQV